MLRRPIAALNVRSAPMPKLGSLTVSRQGFGAMGLSHTYGNADDAESIRTLHRAIELGITFFDTATGYGAGHNESLLGQAIADRRDKLVIASKFTHRQGGATAAAPIKARDAVEASLKRGSVSTTSTSTTCTGSIHRFPSRSRSASSAG